MITANVAFVVISSKKKRQGIGQPCPAGTMLDVGIAGTIKSWLEGMVEWFMANQPTPP